MLTEDGKHLYVSYDEYHDLIEKLAIKVHQSGWKFDTILCLARGGMRPGDVLSRIFDVPLAIMSTSSYRAEEGTVQGHLDIAHFITTPHRKSACDSDPLACLPTPGWTRPASGRSVSRRSRFSRDQNGAGLPSWKRCPASGSAGPGQW